jgi:hypothetical protein
MENNLVNNEIINLNYNIISFLKGKNSINPLRDTAVLGQLLTQWRFLSNGDEFVYPNDELKNKLCLTQGALRTSLLSLKRAQLIDFYYKGGMPAKRYFKLNINLIKQL